MQARDKRNAARPGRTQVRGFTLVELLVVVAIMGLLATIAFPMAELSLKRTKEEELRRALREIRSGLDNYKRLVDEGRIERAADGSSYPPRLQSLVEGVPDAKSPAGTRIYILRSLPRDPFNSVSASSPAETWTLRSYNSPPDQPAPGRDVFDIHSKSTEVGLDGQPYQKW